MATSLISSTAVTTINRAPIKASMLAPFNGLKSTVFFHVTKKNNGITSLASNGGRVQCMQSMQKQEEVIEEYGPYGSQLPENYRFRLGEGEIIKEVLVRHGYIVDAIGFVVAKPGGGTYTVEFGGNKGTPTKIALKSGEYVTKISGTYGEYEYQKNEVIVGKIKIHTNLRPYGYGPYGEGDGETHVQQFTSPELSDGPVVGVFGRNNNYLESVGVFIRTEFPTN